MTLIASRQEAWTVLLVNELQEIGFEICMLGKYGLDINDPQETHVLRPLTYAGVKRIEPGMDIGVELGEEWGDGGEADGGKDRNLNYPSDIAGLFQIELLTFLISVS